ncbi:MAG TPA: PEP-CTERM sorting domain-containing protein [Kiritimatiellia bacterium]|nr:PEP-CTERM sorting domain-containing protein [Kiritimatiellia bacterium]
MKKTIVSSIIAAFAFASVASANINVTWLGDAGFYKIDDVTGITDGGNNALAQLIFTPVNQYGQAGVGGAVAAGESVLKTFILTDSGGADPYGTFVDQYVGTFQVGFIYARVFDGGTANPANIVNGTWYYNSPIIATVNNVTPDSPNIFNIQGGNPSPGNGGFGDTLFLQVPEPSTMAFLGIGGMILALRRRKA